MLCLFVVHFVWNKTVAAWVVCWHLSWSSRNSKIAKQHRRMLHKHVHDFSVEQIDRWGSEWRHILTNILGILSNSKVIWLAVKSFNCHKLQMCLWHSVVSYRCVRHNGIYVEDNLMDKRRICIISTTALHIRCSNFHPTLSVD